MPFAIRLEGSNRLKQVVKAGHTVLLTVEIATHEAVAGFFGRRYRSNSVQLKVEEGGKLSFPTDFCIFYHTAADRQKTNIHFLL
jgi:hypothetical protein